MLMDQAAMAKERKSKEACRAAGWDFQPFVADTYGALRYDARNLISRLISRHHARFFPLSEAEAGSAVWSAISAAAVSRAAFQLGRLMTMDNPNGMPLHTLNLSTSRQAISTATLPPQQHHSMGIVHPFQPSYDDEASEGVFDFSAPHGGSAGGVIVGASNAAGGTSSRAGS